ncbi:beta-ketoacyl-ACP synthase III [Aquisalinus flavus]|uniref:Beta-ketoacyl-ACP synthase III n=1 Tax=Aquisalinus flavus TaxID=1526572 RepID=A0A8J2Y529_9PROT|nr:beta-ketoacyl-ACP synthase III [Aquisalinus flavus]MBD0426514.1 beta-ketoacyl-ACP synthase III [Aquisalinus flavus]UNE47934.1 beta-ketoacyl-ACP synthase III [Aquisalinus flavus]GGD07349.1 beta-ketoacyl-ACP synthase III [Aquisalinus flavus]
MSKSPLARIAGTGLFTPAQSISNEELVEAYNAWVDKWNAEHPADDPKQHSSAEFIEKASGIKARFVLDKDGILDTDRMRPSLPQRSNDELSIMAEMGVTAAREAMKAADLQPADIDAVICAASNMQRAYPAMAVEIQNALGIDGYGFDMNVACASAAFGIQNAVGLIATGARRVLMVNPEICSAHLNFRDRDAHFIFGDVATAVIVERAEGTPGPDSWDIIDTRLKTVFSNNIRNNFGFLNHTSDELDISAPDTDKLFRQEGRKVFKDVVPMVAELISGHLADNEIDPATLKRMWLHQANLSMNQFIARKVLGRDASEEEAPVVLDTYANTSSAGSMIAFHRHRDGFFAGEIGVISGFGAGYSAGSVIVRRAA